ncbi:MAG: ABC transporter substrate-binding protein [Myxococcales bacterium]|nr:ABC transporter substrate-binding protein [Myxococcales bacterium]
MPHRSTLSAAPRALLLVAVVAAAAAVPGCAARRGPIGTLPAVTTSNPAAEADVRAAREAAEAGRTDLAVQRYKGFLARYPSDPLVPLARLELGRIELAKDDLDAATARFREVASARDPAIAERGRLYLGVALHRAGDDPKAIALLRPLVGRTTDPDETALLLETLATATEQTGDHVGAVIALNALVGAPVPADEQARARGRLEALVDHSLTPDDVHTLYAKLPRDSPAWALVARQELRLAFGDGRMTRVREVARDLQDQRVVLDDEELQAMALRASRSERADTRVIGAILPLSGRGSEVGRDVLRALMLAAGAPSTGPTDSQSMRLAFRDSRGDPATAARAVEELVSLQRAVAIIGPIEAPSATLAAKRAQELGVPLIALTPDEHVVDAGPMAFRLFFTPSGEVAALVDAARSRGAERFAIVYGDHPFGRAMDAIYHREVARVGGELTGEVSYPPGTTAFRDTVQALARAPFDALLIADSARSVALLAPSLASAGLWSVPAGGTPPKDARGVTLLIPSVGVDARLVATTGRYLQGALLSVPFDASATQPPAQTFVEDFEGRFGTTPTAFAAYAFDAFQLVADAVRAGATDRAAVAATLPTLSDVRTVGASEGFAPDRGPRHETQVVELNGRSLVAVPPATESTDHAQPSP